MNNLTSKLSSKGANQMLFSIEGGQLQSQDFEAQESSSKLQQIPIYYDQVQAQSQSRLHIQGFDVFFPKQPYPEQKEFIQKVISTLNQKQNSLLQSPSGSGKTLSLLCSTLGWQNFQRRCKNIDSPKRLNKIIYSSKSSSDIKQVINELNTTCYKPKMCILAEREQYCLKKEFSHLRDSELNWACKNALQKFSCQFYNYLGDQSRQLPKPLEDVHDIEDLKQLGQSSQCKFCPYYYSINMKEEADLLLLTHHQLLSQAWQNENQHLIEDSIIIFDDAHNLSNTAENQNSFTIDINLIEEIEIEVNKQKNHLILSNRTTSEIINQIKRLLDFFKCLLNSCEGDQKYLSPLKNGNKGRCGAIKELIDKIEELSIKNSDNSKEGQQDLKMIINLLPQLDLIVREMESQRMNQLYGFITLICQIFQINQQSPNSLTNQDLSQFYKFYFQFTTSDSSQNNSKNPQSFLSLICLEPSLALSMIIRQRPHSVILSSSTLHPINSWESELKMEFHQKFATQQIQDISKNIIGGIVKEGPNNIPLNFQFSNIQNASVYEELGEFLIDLTKVASNGIIVFFSYHSMMEKAHQIWKNSSFNILLRISELKHVFFEPKNQLELHQTIKLFSAKSQEDIKGSILFCTCRGKIAERIDKQSKNIVIVGIPFPSSIDPMISLKMEYLDKQSKLQIESNIQVMTGKEWYLMNTIRTINSIVSRVIAHKDEFRSIFLCDSRFAQDQFSEQLPGWIKPFVQIYSSYDLLIQNINKFFDNKYSSVTSLDTILSLENNSKSRTAMDLFNKHNEPALTPYQMAAQNNNNNKRATLNNEVKRKVRKQDSKLQFESIFNRMKNLSNFNEEIEESEEIDVEEPESNQIKHQNLNHSLNSQFSMNSVQIVSDSFPLKKRRIIISETNSSQSSNHQKILIDQQSNSSLFITDSQNPMSFKNNDLPSLKLKSISKQSNQSREREQSQFDVLNDKLNFSINKDQDSSFKEESLNQKRAKSLKILEDQSDLSFSEVLQIRKSAPSESFQNQNIDQSKSQLLQTSITLENEMQHNISTIKQLERQDEAQKNLNGEQKIDIEDNEQKKYHKIMMSNRFRGLASFNESDIYKLGNKKPEVKKEKCENISFTPKQINFKSNNRQPDTFKQKINQNCTQEKEKINQKAGANNNNNNNNSQLSQSNNKDSVNKDNLCPICYEIPQNNQRSTSCGHKACLNCWKNWLKEQLTCPMCRVRCRLVYLEPCN